MLKKDEPQITASKINKEKSKVFASLIYKSNVWVCDKCIADIYI